MTKITAAITAVGGYLPEQRLTNQDLERMVDTSDAWIRERTGIVERRLAPAGVAASHLAVGAIQDLMTRRPFDPQEIDLVICATVTPDHVFPATANLITQRLGMTRAWGFDLQAACSGFLYALTTASQFIQNGQYKKIIVVGAEKMSAIVDYEDRNTCIIFGDGAGAVLLEPNTQGYGIIDHALYSDGAGCEHLHMKAGGSLKPATVDTVLNKEHFVYQEGKPVFKAAVTGMAQATGTIMARNGLTPSNIAWLVPHQANKRIIEATRERMGLPPEQVMLNIQKYGNTTSATIPLCLWDYQSQLKQGDNLVLAAFGGGFTWGAAYVRWGC